MCVFYLEYIYISLNYKIVIECERGAIVIEVRDEEGKRFSPWMIYPNTFYTQWEDRLRDIEELIELTYRAIDKEEIMFLTDEEIRKLARVYSSAQDQKKTNMNIQNRL